MSTTVFVDLIKKTSDYDKDQRFMATTDIINNLSKDIKIDEVLEKKICAAILKQLDDKSNDVQSVAVKCLGILVKKVHSAQITDICDKLCSLILEGQDALRDIYSIGLKTLIADIPDEIGSIVTARLVTRLIYGISRLSNDDIVKECLDNMNDLIRRFGNLLSNEHEDIMKAVITQLCHDKSNIKKRAAVCLGSLAVVLSDAQLNRLVELLLGQTDTSGSKVVDTRTQIQTFGAVSRTVGHRLGRHLDRLVPLFIKCCGDPNDENQQTEEANELRENCFPGLESFVLRCRKEIVPHLSNTLYISLEFLKYDPNYSYEDADYENMDEDYYEDDDYGGDDDDDGSWKVRKSAVKVILAIIVSRPDMICQLFDECADKLISRFKDREETVRIDVIAAVNSLLQVSQSIVGSNLSKSKSLYSLGLLSVNSAEKEAIMTKVLPRINTIISASKTHFDGNSLKTKSSLFALLRSLVSVVQSNIDSHLDLLITWVEKSLRDKNQSLKIDSLIFLRTLVDSLDQVNLGPFFPRLITIASQACKDDWYKIIAEGLRLVSSLIVAVRPQKQINENDMDTAQLNENSYVVESSTALLLYNDVISRLEALDIDQEIKECSIIASGKLIRHIGDVLPSQTPIVLSILRKRFDNEATRLSTLRAVYDIASSPLNLDVSNFALESLRELAMFLRQQNRSLKLQTLQTIDAILSSESISQVESISSLLSIILSELSHLVSDSDLSMTSEGLKLSITIIRKFPCSIETVKSEIYPRLLAIASSPLLQGSALQSLVDVYRVLSAAHSSELTFQTLFIDLYTNSIAVPNKQAAVNIAKCVAGITQSADQATQIDTIDCFIKDLQNPSILPAARQLALLSLGEVGYVQPEKNIFVKDIIISCFECDDEDVRSAAAYALGHLAVGAMDVFLPVVLQAVDTSSSRNQYLLLSSLREIININANERKSFGAYLDLVLPGLQTLCKAPDEGLRNMVSECLGLLIILHSENLLAWLQALLLQDQNDKLAKWSVATALRHTLSRNLIVGSVVWNGLNGSIKTFLSVLQDDDLEVRKASLLLVNSAFHHNPHIVIDYLPDIILPRLYETLAFKKENVVDLGPFKHTVDEALPLRKASLTCIETILDIVPERLDIAAFLPLTAFLLLDKDEVRLQTHQVIIKVATISPIVLATSAELLISPLEKTVTKKTKEGATAPEAERAAELVKSGVRVISVLAKLPELESNRTWIDFIARLGKAGISLIDTSA